MFVLGLEALVFGGFFRYLPEVLTLFLNSLHSDGNILIGEGIEGNQAAVSGFNHNTEVLDEKLVVFDGEALFVEVH